MSQSSPSSCPETVNDTDSQTNDTPPRVGRPLTRIEAPFNLFPVDAMGPLAANAARAIEDLVQAPMAMCAQSSFAVLAVAAQAHIDVRMPVGGKTARPASGFFLSIALSGERKSEVDRLATGPLAQHQARLSKEYRAVASANRQAKMAGLDVQSSPGPTMLIDDLTMEGLAKLMPGNQPSFAVFSDEAGKFFEGHSMSPEARVRTAAGLCNIWDGKPLTRVRASDEPLYLPGRRVSAHLMVQPAIAANFLGDAAMLDQGLISRFLVSNPESRIGKRPFKEPSPDSEIVLDAYTKTVLDLLALAPELDFDDPNALKPRAVELTAQARKEFIRFYDEIEAQVGAGGLYAPIVSLANKSAEHAVRLAGVQAWIANPDASEISAEIFERGEELMRYYLAEALRFFSTGPIVAGLDLARITLEWLQTKKIAESEVSMADFYQRGPKQIRSKAVAGAVIQVLEEHDWLTRITGGSEIDGTWHRDAWTVTR
jgi:hypothetical protein